MQTRIRIEEGELILNNIENLKDLIVYQSQNNENISVEVLMLRHVAAYEAKCIFGDKLVGVEIFVIYDVGQFETSCLDGLERQQCVVDRPEDSVCHQYYRELSCGRVVDCEEIVGERYHQASRALDYNHIVS